MLAAAGGALAALPARITLNGIAGVRPGMTVSQVKARWRTPVRLEDEFGSQCSATAVKARATEGYAIFLNRRFGAVFLRKGATTDTGITIGSRLKDLRRAYGARLTSRPNKYTPGARDFFVRRATRPRWELRFDVSAKGRVTTIGFGNSAVRLVEGCA